MGWERGTLEEGRDGPWEETACRDPGELEKGTGELGAPGPSLRWC